MIQITPALAIDEKDLQEDFIRAARPIPCAPPANAARTRNITAAKLNDTAVSTAGATTNTNPGRAAELS
jgi:hypothetical protein